MLNKRLILINTNVWLESTFSINHWRVDLFLSLLSSFCILIQLYVSWRFAWRIIMEISWSFSCYSIWGWVDVWMEITFLILIVKIFSSFLLYSFLLNSSLINQVIFFSHIFWSPKISWNRINLGMKSKVLLFFSISSQHGFSMNSILFF